MRLLNLAQVYAFAQLVCVDSALEPALVAAMHLAGLVVVQVRAAQSFPSTHPSTHPSTPSPTPPATPPATTPAASPPSLSQTVLSCRSAVPRYAIASCDITVALMFHRLVSHTY